jgi:hypothetical protein
MLMSWVGPPVSWGSPREGAENIFVEEVVYMFLQCKEWGHSSHLAKPQFAYYSVFSLGCIIVIAIDVAGCFSSRSCQRASGSSIKDMLGDTGAKAVQAMLADARRLREALSQLCWAWEQ